MRDDPCVFIVDKPVGPTSRELLDDLERHLRSGPLGHAGTLDPLASGVLVVLTGEARRLQDLFMGSWKTYEAEITFGAWSASDDAEGPFTPSGVAVGSLEPARLLPLLARFVGTIQQAPPQRSAVRVEGRRAYELSRKGNDVPLAPRTVQIANIELLHAEDLRIRVRVHASPGTYIRSLARDLGVAAGCGAYVSQLRRTKSGPFGVETAVVAADLRTSDGLSLTEALRHYPALHVREDEASDLRHGRVILAPPFESERTIAWWNNQPICRLVAAAPATARSSRWIADPALFMNPNRQ